MTPAKRKEQRGFTLIEVMMGLAVLTVGALGLMAMQQATIRGNMSARELSVATQATQQWIERIHRDALAWNVADAVAGVSGTTYLNQLPPTGGGPWFTPATGPLGESPALDYFGREVPLAQGRYCTHLRMTWLVPGQLARVDVRTWWHRRGDGTAVADDLLFPNCGNGNEAAVTNELEAAPAPRISAVYASTLVRWQRLPR